MTLSVPFFTYWLSFACTAEQCPPWPLANLIGFHQAGYQAALTYKSWWSSLWDNKAALVYLYWYLWTVVCWAVLPGRWVQGTELRDGGKVWYRMNGNQNPTYHRLSDEMNELTRV